jgi:hypothetical protein
MSTDPFASATTGTASTDPFGQKPSEVKTSSYPSLEELDKAILVIQPTKLETGLPDKFNPGKTKDRITADVTVINEADPKASVTHKDMYLSQGALIGQVKGFIEGRGMLLGRLRRFPSSITPKHVTTPDETDAYLAKDPRGSFAWKLADFTEKEKDAALEWYRSR